MRLAFDTSVLVALLVEPHPSHARTLPWFEAIHEGRATGECTVHALAETWSVLTRLPIEPTISPPMAVVALEDLASMLKVVEVGADGYWRAMGRCSERNLRSGALFDALHLISAEQTGAEAFVTFNPGDFHRLTNGDLPEIVVPPSPPAFIG